jgi:hypothetical protein
MEPRYLLEVNRIKSVGQRGTGHRNKNCLDTTRWFNNSISWARGAPPVGTLWTLSGCSPSGDTRSQLPLGVSTTSAQSAETTCAHNPITRGWDQCVVGTNEANAPPWGGLYTDSPGKGSQQGASSALVFPTITVPGRPSPCGEMESRFLFLSLKISDINGIATYHQRRSPGLQYCSGGGMYRRQPHDHAQRSKNFYFQARLSWGWPGGHIFGWEGSPNHLW